MARLTKRRHVQNRAKRGNYITPRAAVRPNVIHDNYWPSTHLAPLPQRYVVKSYIPNPYSNYRALQRPLAAGQLTRRPRRPRALTLTANFAAGTGRNPVLSYSGMHDTPFKRPQISSYGAWAKGISFHVPQTVKLCVQRATRREAVFATTGGGRIRRKPTNQRTLRSQIGCK